MLTIKQALERAIKIAGEAREEWDGAPAGMRAGKIIIALAGDCPGYRRDIDEIHETLAAARRTMPGTHSDPIIDAAERAVLGLS